MLCPDTISQLKKVPIRFDQPPRAADRVLGQAHQLPNPGLAILQHRAPGKGSRAPDQVPTKFIKLTALLMLCTNVG